MCSRDKVAHDHGAQETTEIADGIDESDGGRGRRFAEKLSGHRPEGGMEGIVGGADHGEENNRESNVRSGTDGEKQAQTAEGYGYGGMPAALAGAVGVPTIPLLGEKAGQIG